MERELEEGHGGLEAALNSNAEGTAPLEILTYSLNLSWYGGTGRERLTNHIFDRRYDAWFPVQGQQQDIRLTQGQGSGRTRSEASEHSQLLYDLQKSPLEQESKEHLH